MENKEHTNQNPDMEIIPDQEENSSSVPVEENQKETTKPAEETTDSTEKRDNQPEEEDTPPSADLKEEHPAPSAKPEDQPAPSEETPGKKEIPLEKPTEKKSAEKKPARKPVEEEKVEGQGSRVEEKDKKTQKKEEEEKPAEKPVEEEKVEGQGSRVGEKDKKTQKKEEEEKPAEKPVEEEKVEGRGSRVGEKDKKTPKKEEEEKPAEKPMEEEKVEGRGSRVGEKDKKTPKKEEEKPSPVITPAEPLLLKAKSDEPQPEEVKHEVVAEKKEEKKEEDFSTYSREQLVELLKTAVTEPDINSVKTRIALIKVAFLKKKEEDAEDGEQTAEGDDSPKKTKSQDHLNIRFNELFSVYKTNRSRFLEEQEKLKKVNLEKKLQILEELRKLISSEEALKKTYDEFRILQEQWKEIGMVPRNEINNLWQNYHFLVEKFFEKVKLNKELKDLDMKKNMEAKIELCEKTEELLLEPSILKSFKQLQKYHENWKEIGPVPSAKKDEIWERFKNATDKINERRREYYASIEEEQGKNLETKTALCQQAEEALTLINETIKDWQESTQKVNELLNIWKSIGPVPQKHNAEIWSRFKSCLDMFFTNKKEYFDKLKEQQMHNYNLKVDLCMQAEAIKDNTDWKKTTNDLIRLQGEWKKLGPVPRKHSDKIWKRFRASCDVFFNAKSAYFANIHIHEDENLKGKEELLEKLKDHQFSDNKNKNLEDLKNFQREWTQIGYVPIKERDRLQNEFRKLVNEHLDKLKISEVEMTTVSYQTKMESMRNDPQARRLMGRERDNLMGKINKLREDLNLWENNIGFLANSKNTNILRAEFEKKIERTKNNIMVMEAKLKILRQQ